MESDFFREHVTGPIVSICTPFCRDGAIDYKGLRRFIDFTIQAGTKTILLTPGDNLYTVLTDREVAEITKITAEHIDKRVMFIAASDCWWTGKAVEYAHAYWDAVVKKDMPGATGIIRDYDIPIFRFLYSDFAAGGDAGLHALSEIAGICGRWRRNPLPDFTDEDMERLKAFLKKTY